MPELGRRGGSFGRESIVQLGLDSLDVRVLVQNVNAKLGVDLPLSIVFEYATPAELAKHIFSLFLQNRATSQIPTPLADEPADGRTTLRVMGPNARWAAIGAPLNQRQQRLCMLSAGGDAVAHVPAKRWDVRYDPTAEQPDSIEAVPAGLRLGGIPD